MPKKSKAEIDSIFLQLTSAEYNLVPRDEWDSELPSDVLFQAKHWMAEGVEVVVGSSNALGWFIAATSGEHRLKWAEVEGWGKLRKENELYQEALARFGRHPRTLNDVEIDKSTLFKLTSVLLKEYSEMRGRAICNDFYLDALPNFSLRERKMVQDLFYAYMYERCDGWAEDLGDEPVGNILIDYSVAEAVASLLENMGVRDE